MTESNQNRSTKKYNQDNQILAEFLAEIRQWAETITQLRSDINTLKVNLEPILKAFQGSETRDSILTRIKLLEEALERIEKAVEEANNTQIEKDMIDIRNSIDKLQNGLATLNKTVEDMKTGDMKKFNDFMEASKASWKKTVVEVVKWIAAIASAYIIYKLTGK